jgi:ATP-dependent RNA helicase RhlE
VDIVSATPGRLLDHAQSGRLKLLEVEIFVLDEADRMMDMGFLPDVRRILSLLPIQRQNLVFSATLPPETLRLCEQICKHPVRVQIGSGKTSVPAGIRHAVYPVIHEQKLELLLRLMRDMGEKTSVLLFTRTKDRADRIAESLGKAGFRAAVMHGDRSQAERVAALESFRRGAHQVLVATDIAARGLDIEDISHVINYDIPEEPENYIHRIGRTGRAEAEGDAFTLMAPEEEPWITAVERILNHRLPRVLLPDFTYKKSTVAGSYHPRPYYIPTRRPGQRGRGGGGGGFRRR